MAEEFFSLDDEELEEEQQSEQKQDNKKQNNKKIYYIILILTLLILLFVMIFGYFYIQKKKSKSEETFEVNTSNIIKNIQNKELTPKESSKAQTLIQKADKLYNQGDKKEALKIYEELSHYNKSLSFYNIAVAKLKEKKYKVAIEFFEKAMQNNELKCASALNAAVSALNLGEVDTFKHYLALSQKYLPYITNNKLYSYYRTLISYYKEEPLESIISIKNPSSEFYKNEQNFIAAKALSSLKNNLLAINFIQKIDNPKNYLTIGLLQARAGEYILASNSLESAKFQGVEPIKANVALALVKNRLGLMSDSGEILKSTYDTYKEDSLSTYPISVQLKKSLFDPIAAQKEFKDRLFLDDKYKFSILFYYAPYKVFNSNLSIDNIIKGAKNIEIEKTTQALDYLRDSAAISKIDLEITKALKYLTEHKVYEANDILKKAIKLYPTHSVLHYNLALTYAQIFDFLNAYKHFKRSYSLDSHNHNALVFQSFCAKLINKDIPTKELEKQRVQIEEKSTQALLEIALGSLALNVGYLDANQNRFFHSINLLLSYSRNDTKMYQESAKKLKDLMSGDLVSNILYIDATNDKAQIKEYAKAIQKTITKDNLDFKPLYFGGFLPKELFVRALSIAGIISRSKELLENRSNPSISLLQSLGLILIYNQNFEEAYGIYNKLIDEYKQKDTHTLFLASVAAIGAKHYANAVALLELSKLTDSSNFESRYALGLLYQQEKNFEGASIQYKKIGNINFKSNFFTFILKK